MALERVADLVHRFMLDPNHNLMVLVPDSWTPYIEVTRVNQPMGVVMPILLYSVGLTFAACASQPLLPMPEFCVLAWQSTVWLFIMRHAICTFNDAIDYEYDRRIRRCRLRPVARGAISPDQALQLSALLFILGSWSLYNLPRDAHGLGLIATIVMMITPFGKRFTHFPQLIMGLGFIVTTFMACAAVGVDASLASEHFLSAMCLGLVCLLIITITDTIYAYQDLYDHFKIGLKSMTLVLGDRPKTWLWTMIAGIQGLLLMVGHQNDFSPMFYMISCGGSFFALSAMLALVDLRVAADCRWWCRYGGSASVFAVAFGLYLEYFIRLCLFS